MSQHVYNDLELTGSSEKSLEDAIETAIGRAVQTIRNMHWFQVMDTRGQIDNGKVVQRQVTVKVGFTFE